MTLPTSITDPIENAIADAQDTGIAKGRQDQKTLDQTAIDGAVSAQLAAEHDRDDAITERDQAVADLVTYKATHHRVDDPTTPPPPPPPPTKVLPLFGSSMQGNGDVTPLEKAAGRPLGLHRSYGNLGTGSDGWADMVATAADDVAKGRTPWLSFKPGTGHTWADQANGADDAVMRQVAAKLKALGKPVWVALDHEPEGDGVMADFTKALDHLFPILVGAAPNVVPWMILTGGDAVDTSKPEYSLDTLWPKVAKPNVAFDGYNRYGDASHPANSTGKGWSEMNAKFYDVLAPWAKAHGVRWAIAETGYTDVAFARDPAWLDRAYDDMANRTDLPGEGLCYFNSNANSNGTWPVSGAKLTRFVSVLVRSRPVS